MQTPMQIMKPWSLILGLCLGVHALAADLSEIQVFYRLDPWLVSGNYAGGLWVSPLVFGPVTQGGETFSLEVKAQGVDAQGQSVVVAPQWVVSNPSMVLVSPSQGGQVTVVILTAGQSTLTLSDQGRSKQLAIKAVLNGASLLVEISQQQVAPLPSSLTASPALLTFAYQIGRTVPPPQTVNLGSSNGAALPFTVSVDAAWLSVSTVSGITPSSLSISVNPASLAPGARSGTITVTSAGMASAQTIAVTLNVTDVPLPSLLVSPATRSFSSSSGGPDPGPLSVSLGSSGAPIPYSAAISSGANWLSVTPVSGTTPATLILSAHPAGLPAGTYTGSAIVSSANAVNSPQTIAVTLILTDPPPGPSILLNPNTLAFAYETGGALPPPQRLAISSTGSALGFTASASSTWLSTTALSGVTPATLSIAADPRGLAPGTYLGTVMVSATGGSNTPQVVRVSLVVKAPSSSLTPDLQFILGVTDRQVNGPNLMVISGSGRFSAEGLKGSGRFTEFSSLGGERTSIVRQGEWKAKRLLSFTPATPMTLNAAGILVIEVGLKVSQNDDQEIPATLKIVPGLPAAFTGEPTGVTLTITGGATYAPTGTGTVVLRVMQGDKHEIEHDHEKIRDDGDH